MDSLPSNDHVCERRNTAKAGGVLCRGDNADRLDGKGLAGQGVCPGGEKATTQPAG